MSLKDETVGLAHPLRRLARLILVEQVLVDREIVLVTVPLAYDQYRSRLEDRLTLGRRVDPTFDERLPQIVVQRHLEVGRALTLLEEGSHLEDDLKRLEL